MQSPEDLAEVERLAEDVYTAHDAARQNAAEEKLHCFMTDREYIPQCQFILDNSSSSYACLLAGQALSKLVCSNWNHYTPEQQLDIRDYVLNYLGTRGLNQEKFVVDQMIQLICRLTKLGWGDDENFRKIVDEATKFLEATIQHSIVGLQLLNRMVAMVNKVMTGWSLIQHRKVCISFRDHSLYRVFQVSLTMLQKLLRGEMSHASEMEQAKMAEESLTLALACLNFDFIGNTSDDNEDTAVIRIPPSWRASFEDIATVNLFLELYDHAQDDSGAKRAMECLVQLAAVRRSLFSGEATRIKYLDAIMMGQSKIMTSRKGLNTVQNYHEFCRFVFRLKSTYPLTDLVSAPSYPSWIECVANFALDSFKSWQWSPNSVYYIQDLWCRLCGSTPQLTKTAHHLEQYGPGVAEAYILSRLSSVEEVFRSNGSLEDPLDSRDQLKEEVKALPGLARYMYKKTAATLMQLFDPRVNEYESMMAQGGMSGNSSDRLAVLEGELTWLVYIIAGVIGGRPTTTKDESYDVLDGELASRVFHLMQLSDAVLEERVSANVDGCDSLDLALLCFFEKFRKAHIGDQALSVTKAYSRLSELVGLSDPLMILDVIVQKIGTNLTCWSDSDEIIAASLQLFHDLATSTYSSQRLLLKLDSITYLLANHASANFTFLENPANLHHRATYYHVLGSLIFTDEIISNFDEFMEPFDHKMQELAQLGSVEDFRSEAVRISLVGILCDLKGLVAASGNRRSYLKIFEWVYPTYTEVFLNAIEAFYDTSSVTTPLLEFWQEFVKNKCTRISFDVSSPNGILLFIESSKLLCAYGERAITITSGADLYDDRYKGIELCMSIITNCLCGNYCCFGVFQLYNDSSLANVMDCILSMLMSIPIEDLMGYPKLAVAYFTMAERLFQSHTAMMVQLDSSIFVHLMTTLVDGLQSFDRATFTQSCCSIDHITSFHFNNLTKSTPEALAIQKHARDNADMFPRVLANLFSLYIFEDAVTLPQWAVSRPILNLMLLYEQEFEQIKESIVRTQAAEQQERLVTAFEKLTEKLQRGLTPKNRDQFQHNLATFRHLVKEYIV